MLHPESIPVWTELPFLLYDILSYALLELGALSDGWSMT